jgi:hypothetical protein
MMTTAPTFGRLCADLLREGQTVRFRAPGQSMGATIRDGDVLTVEPVDPGRVRRGDILLYLTTRGLTAHRLVGRAPGVGQAFRFKGDTLGSGEEQVGASDVLGRVTAVYRQGRRVRVRGTLALNAARAKGLATRLKARLVGG